jgi:hypothetical protein
MNKGRGKGKEREEAPDPAGKVPSRISPTTSLVNSEFPEPQEVLARGLRCKWGTRRAFRKTGTMSAREYEN